MANVLIRPGVRAADSIGLSPNAISAAAMGCAILAGGAFVLAGAQPWWYLLGAAFVFANGWLDLVDGALAREQEIDSRKGDLIDHVLDRYADIVIVAGLAAGVAEYLLGFLAITGVLMTSYLGTQAIAVGFDRVYGGLLGRADRLALIGAVAVGSVVYPEPIVGWTLVAWLLVLLAVVGHLTALQRFASAVRGLE